MDTKRPLDSPSVKWDYFYPRGLPPHDASPISASRLFRGLKMENRDELIRQARMRASIIAERVQTQFDEELGAEMAGGQALSELRVMLEVVANSLRILADGELEPEKAVLIRDRQNTQHIMRVTRQGRTLRATLDGEAKPFATAGDRDEMFETVVEYLTKRVKRLGN